MAAKIILVIDDSEMICNVISDTLTESGYIVTAAHTAEDGFKQIRNKSPDAIILDLDLPDIDGMQFCQLLKNDPKLRYIPVLMCTGVNTAESKIAGLKNGADDYITKPFAVKELLERLNSLFRRAELIEEHLKQQAAAQKPAAQLAASERIPPRPVKTEPRPAAGIEPKPRFDINSLRSLRLAWDVLTKPQEAFSAVAAMPLADALTPLGLLALLHSISASIDSHRLAAGVVGFAEVLAAWAAGIGLLWVLLYTRDREKPLGEVAKFCTAAVSPLALSALLGIIYALITSGRAGEFTGSPLLLVAFVPPSYKLSAFLDCFDIFQIWTAFLLTYGWAQIFRADKANRTLLIGAGGWAFLSAIGLIRHLF